jgi:citrate synthase
VKIGSQTQRASAISSSNPETIIVRGRNLVNDLVGRIGFTDYAWLLVTGELPSASQRRILDAALVAIAEHGLVPSVQVSRMTLAAAPESLQGAVAAGILGCGSVILGASENAGRLFSEILDRAQKRNDADAVVQAVLGEYRAARRPIPGYGHPLHKGLDPRAQRLLSIAAEVGCRGRHVEIAELVERHVPAIIGRPLVMNVSGAIPAVLLDAGFPLLALKGVPILARTAGLIGHLLEELQRPIGFVLSQAAAEAISYDGKAPAGFVPSVT